LESGAGVVKRPGTLFNCDGRQLYLHAQGVGTPPVVLEAGIAGTSLGWALVQPAVAQFTSVYSYDRAGLGWSDPARSRRTLANITSELRCLLETAGVQPPYILVGHSFGGLLVRAFACRWPHLVAGLVLLDPVSVTAWANATPAERERLKRGISLSRRGALLARFGIVRAALALLVSGARFIPKLIGRTAAGKGSAAMERLIGEVRKLPPEVWPIIQAHWSRARSFEAMAEYLACLPECATEAVGLCTRPEIPVTILSASNATPAELQERDDWAAQSAQGKHVQLETARHWIQLDAPDEVIGAIREMADSSRGMLREA
jgi:pimeloyl-ACP methyl ester carboxylesterase